MTEITLQIDDSLIQAYGRAAIEHVMRQQLKKLAVRRAAQEILEEIDDYDPSKDEEWQAARRLAKARIGFVK